MTQLVVSSDHREQGIASTLLRMLPGPGFACGAIGLVSTHPAACLALAKSASTSNILLVCIQVIMSSWLTRRRRCQDNAPGPRLHRGTCPRDPQDYAGQIPARRATPWVALWGQQCGPWRRVNPGHSILRRPCRTGRGSEEMEGGAFGRMAAGGATRGP